MISRRARYTPDAVGDHERALADLLSKANLRRQPRTALSEIATRRQRPQATPARPFTGRERQLPMTVPGTRRTRARSRLTAAAQRGRHLGTRVPNRCAP